MRKRAKKTPKCRQQQKKPQKRTRMTEQMDMKMRLKAPESQEEWPICSLKEILIFFPAAGKIRMCSLILQECNNINNINNDDNDNNINNIKFLYCNFPMVQWHFTKN